ncbi:MAG: hypothetical protein NVSMB46_04130 [Candidatus Saccharimonadales bacterium]
MNENYTGELIGSLTSEEKNILIKQISGSLEVYKYVLYFCCATFFLIITIPIAIACYLAMNKEQVRLDKIKTQDIQIYRVHGILSRRGAGKGELYTYSLDNFMLPAVITRPASKWLEQYLGQTMTAEYMPQISQNRSCYNSSVNAYNFIFQTPFAGRA